MRRGNVSHRRNPLMADLFRRIDMVEAWGRGMPLILQNAPDVEFREIVRLFIASFERPSAAAVTGPETGLETSPKTSLETGLENTKKTPKKHQETILQHLRQYPQANVPELMDATGLSTNGVKYHLNQLKQAGKLRRLGPTKGGRWEVTEPDSKGKT